LRYFFDTKPTACGGFCRLGSGQGGSSQAHETTAATASYEEETVKKFVFLTYGFEKPTPEIMAAWGKWFDEIKDNIVDQGGLSGGREISDAGTRDLPLGLDSITGFMIIRADSLDDAMAMAQGNPYITSIRVYEMMSA
jgi:hypothetical protein